MANHQIFPTIVAGYMVYDLFRTDVLQLIDDFHPDTYNYLLGSDILVCPVTGNPANVSVTFPSGTWVDFWNSSNVYKGGDTRVLTPDLATFPVFHRTGEN